jgi:membrane protease YdiL (CAAX protease family)
MINSSRLWVKRHAFALFLILTFVLSWWTWPLYLQGTDTDPLLPLGPMVAALIVVTLAGGWTGVKEWLHTSFKWRVRPIWYVVAIGFPIALTAIPAGVNILLGATASTVSWPPSLAAFLGNVVLMFIFVGLGEEMGFSSFSLPHLLRNRTVPATVAILALTRVVWHLPSFMTGGTEWSVILILIPTQLIFTWIFIRSGGSAFLMILAHTSIAAIGYLFTSLFTGPELTRVVWLQAVAFMTAGLTLLIFSRFMRSALFTPDPAVGGEVQAVVGH